MTFNAQVVIGQTKQKKSFSEIKKNRIVYALPKCNCKRLGAIEHGIEGL